MKSTLVRIKTKVNQNLYEIYFLFFPQPPPSLSFLPIGVFSSLLAAASITRVQCTIFQRLLDMSPDFQLISVLMKMGDSWCADFQLMCGGDLRHVQTLCSPQAGFSNGDISLSVQFSSVAQSCPTLCDPMNLSTPGLPVHHQLPEFTQTHVHRVVLFLNFYSLSRRASETH